MKCMKCGRRVDSERVFCEECLEDMAQHPVSPDTPVLLPPRSHGASARRPVSYRKTRKPEERIAALRTWVFFLSLLSILLMLALAMAGTLIHRLMESQEAPPDPGQNYSTGSIPSDPNA